jgi:UDP-N-acetylglucosamine 2-epimerase (non-hydrolysing)/GDP/UDP-N,N'-diacetylbacillosamine 2-epimerase (hydrolysing)
MPRKRRICFVTGTRAEFGLMESTLAAIQKHRKLQLQIIATGMHLDRRYGRSIDSIVFPIDGTVPWRAGKGTLLETTQSTGRAISLLAEQFDRLQSEIILIVGDRVEAFAAATAAHLSGRIVAHIHGGDRALGQVDDSLRHAITKLSHVHFPATWRSAARVHKLGEDKWRIFTVGAPGIDNLRRTGFQPVPSGAGQKKGSDPFILIAMHPIDVDVAIEYERARLLLRGVLATSVSRIVIIHPNNDPGSRGIARCWDEHAKDSRLEIHRNLDRAQFLGLLRRAVALVGNSSSGIIEAASFGTPVIDIGPRQLGRERSGNVTNVPYRKDAIVAALKKIWNNGRPKRFTGENVYGGEGTGRKIANVLSSIALTDSLRRKLITY